MIPVGSETLRNTDSGPSSDRASWIWKPPIPAIVKPPWSPAKNTRAATGVVVSVSAIMFPFASSFSMPPISSASIWPPNRSPLTSTPIEAMPTIGNSPASSFPTSIWIPWIEPENVSPAMPWMPVTLADSVSRKLVGSVLMFGHWMPIESIWIGSQLGQLKLSPLAAADRERDAEALARPERAVAEEGEARGRSRRWSCRRRSPSRPPSRS